MVVDDGLSDRVWGEKKAGTMRLRSDDILLGCATSDLIKRRGQCDPESRNKVIVLHYYVIKTATTSFIGTRAQQEERCQTKDEACWLNPQSCEHPLAGFGKLQYLLRVCAVC